MKRVLPALLLVISLPLCAGFGGGVQAGRRRPIAEVYRASALRMAGLQRELVVKYREDLPPAGQQALAARIDGTVVGEIPQLGLKTLRLPDSRAARAAESQLRKSPDVLWVEPNRPRRLLISDPNDPGYNDIDGNTLLPYEWDAHQLLATDAWSIWPNQYFTAAGGKGTAAIRIAVIDTGVDETHPDFKNGGTSTNVTSGGQLELGLDRSILGGVVTAGAHDEHGHGTHVTGIAAASTNNAAGCTGNGYNATVLSLRVTDAAGNGSSADLAEAIVYAADQGCLIANCSLGDYGFSQAEQSAVDYAWNQGMLVIAAAGNDGVDDKPVYPAALDRVLAVVAMAAVDARATYSSYGPYVGVSAPGGDFDIDIGWFVGIYSTTPTYLVTINDPNVGGVQMNYDYLQGTSMASPQVTGLAALYAGMKGFSQSTPDAPLKLYQSLQLCCDDLFGGGGGWNPQFGFGRINMLAMMQLDIDPNPRNATTGCITGMVRARGTRVVNADIVATSMGDGAQYFGSSRMDGCYRIEGAPDGTYSVAASYLGDSQTLPGVVVTAGCDMPGIDFDIGAPQAPGWLIVTSVSTSSLKLQWPDVQRETGYRVRRSQNLATWTSLPVLPTDTTTWTDTGLNAGATYYYQVQAYNSGGASEWSEIATGVVRRGPPGVPSQPRVLVVSSSQLLLTWRDTLTENFFRVEAKPAGGSFSEIAQTGKDVTLYSHANLAAASTWTYRVRGTNEGGSSAYSEEITATTLPAKPAAPTNLTMTPLSSAVVSLTWTDNSADETEFRIERKEGTSAYAQIALVTANGTGYFDAAVAPSTNYTYRIRAANTGGASAYSNTSSGSTLANMTRGAMEVRPGSLAFTRVAPGASAKKSLTVRNRGKGPLRVVVAQLSAPFAVEGTRTFTLKPKEKRVLKVRYTAPAGGKGSSASLGVAGSGRTNPVVYVPVTAE